ncbi:hypothetical protein Mame01_36610 [Microbispora amethystogenes]|nr:hypothetical protein Mame01_36610 [Microbispora amethystogenes]
MPEVHRYHQLFKVPNGYCGIGGTGVSRPFGLMISGEEQRAREISGRRRVTQRFHVSDAAVGPA